MKSYILTLALLTCIFSANAQKSILIYTHNGEGYVHKNIEASIIALNEICKAEGWTSTATNKPTIFDSNELQDFDCIIFSNSNNEAFEAESQRDAFKKYIQNGGGFMGIHSAAGSERNWPWFAEMLGGRFVRHPALQKFDIKIVDAKHPATKHLPKIWQWEDEFYYTNQLNPDINVLLAGDLSTITDDKMMEYPGETFGHYFPLSWSHTFDGGRQFYTSLGHKSSYYQDEKFRQHLLGGLKWIMEIEQNK